MAKFQVGARVEVLTGTDEDGRQDWKPGVVVGRVEVARQHGVPRGALSPWLHVKFEGAPRPCFANVKHTREVAT